MLKKLPFAPTFPSLKIDQKSCKKISEINHVIDIIKKNLKEYYLLYYY